MSPYFIGPIGRIRPILLLILGTCSLPLVAPRAGAAAAPTAKAPANPPAKSPSSAPPSALGQGLDYLRARTIPADLVPERTANRGPLVLDLRFATVGANDGFSVADWLGAHSRPNAPVFVLFNASTQPALVAALAPGYLPVGVITLAPAGTSLPADITVEVNPATDRRAYEAYDNGTTLTALIATPTDKQRFDEAELIRRDAIENATGKAAPASPPAPPPGRPGSRGRGTPPPLVDPLLQRAVQLHRSLLALGRIK